MLTILTDKLRLLPIDRPDIRKIPIFVNRGRRSLDFHKSSSIYHFAVQTLCLGRRYWARLGSSRSRFRCVALVHSMTRVGSSRPRSRCVARDDKLRTPVQEATRKDRRYTIPVRGFVDRISDMERAPVRMQIPEHMICRFCIFHVWSKHHSDSLILVSGSAQN